MGTHSKSNPNLQADAREAEREHERAQEDRRAAEKNLNDMYREADRYANNPPNGRLAFPRLIGGAAAFQYIIQKHTQELAQAEIRQGETERKLEAARRERDEARETDREADREDRARLRREMEEQREHGEGRDPFSDGGREADTDSRDHDRERGR